MAEGSSKPCQFDISEPIPGYRTVELIGAGGYGEVWKTEAPGDLVKALKHIYSPAGGTRAASELKALNRIKRVSHPFLLSVERIEMIDGHLLIVTELADGSLKDCFQEYREKGLPGIPREELLGHLADAADALDFICDQHALQHLDVKPENLLLVGGRIKVADFGLVKDLHTATETLVGGLTPVYAAPELFDGRPHRRSDQYSLAIVFQQMLTAQLPFSGRTPAQLAVQHLQEPPRLDALCEHDRAVVAKALAKSPGDRFATCREMIDALLAADRPVAVARVPDAEAVTASTPSPDTKADAHEVTTPSAAKPAINKTMEFDGRCPGPRVGESRLPKAVRREVRSLGPLEMPSPSRAVRPALFLGLGGTGGCVLRALRRRLHLRFGGDQTIPALQFLLIDTDRGELASTPSDKRDDALSIHETLAVPLRTSSEFRADAGQIAKGMNRRWIYNIPRSQKTEGFRPLGRLAFVDHLAAILRQVRSAVRDALTPEAASASEHATGWDFRGDLAPRVFVVASISGGTGSGMALEMGYLVRQVLSELGLSEEGLCGILLHSSPCQQKQRELAVGNALSCLAELYHFSHADGHYPGDGARELISADPANAPFGHVYYVHLGDHLGDEQYRGEMEMVAEYLYRASLPPSCEYFDLCRAADGTERGESDGQPTLRTFGLSKIDLHCDTLVEPRALQLAKQALDRWVWEDGQTTEQSPPHDSTEVGETLSRLSTDEEKVKGEVLAVAEELELTADGAIAALRESLREHAGSDVDEQLDGVIARFLEENDCLGPGAHPPDLPLRLFKAVEEFVQSGDSESTATTSDAPRVGDMIRDEAQRVAGSWSSQLNDWILKQADVAQGGLRRSLIAGQVLAEHLLHLKTELERNGEETARQRKASEGALAHAKSVKVLVGKSPGRAAADPGAAPASDSAVAQYGRLALVSVMLTSIARHVTTVRRRLAELCDRLHQARRAIEDLSQAYAAETAAPRPDPTAGCEDEPSAQLWSELDEFLSREGQQLVAEVSRRLRAEAGESFGTFPDFLRQGEQIHEFLAGSLPGIAREVLTAALSEFDMLGFAFDRNSSDPNQGARVEYFLDQATPLLLEYGGSKRLLVMAPEQAADVEVGRRIQELCGECPTELAGKDAELLFCYEVADVLVETAAALIGESQKYAQVADRLHTRMDISWSWGATPEPTSV